MSDFTNEMDRKLKKLYTNKQINFQTDRTYSVFHEYFGNKDEIRFMCC